MSRGALGIFARTRLQRRGTKILMCSLQASYLGLEAHHGRRNVDPGAGIFQGDIRRVCKHLGPHEVL